MGVGWVLCPRGNKMWILHDFENDLKNRFGYEHLFSFPFLWKKKEIKIRFSIRRNRGSENAIKLPTSHWYKGHEPLYKAANLSIGDKTW